MENLQISQVPTADIIPYARNAKTHDDRQVAQIAASIKEFGFNNPILIRDSNVVIAGHGRLLAAQLLGLSTVPVIRLGHLTETQAKALTLADNRIAENSGWDVEMLRLELGELSDALPDLDPLGFDHDEVEELLLASDIPSLDLDTPDEYTPPEVSETGMAGEIKDIERIIIILEREKWENVTRWIQDYAKEAAVDTVSEAFYHLLEAWVDAKNRGQ